MNESNFSLLTQNEIDTLVNFLVDKKNAINSDVLNQESIDKLISLIKNNELKKLNLNSYAGASDFSMDSLTKLNLRDTPDQLCQLVCRINAQNEYVELFAVNTITGKELKITPTVFDKLELVEDDSEWGFSIAPFVFDQIAGVFNLKYSKDTYDQICKCYALKNYGSDTQKIASTFYPESSQMLRHLL